jgi:hypothetical protein
VLTVVAVLDAMGFHAAEKAGSAAWVKYMGFRSRRIDGGDQPSSQGPSAVQRPSTPRQQILRFAEIRFRGALIRLVKPRTAEGRQPPAAARHQILVPRWWRRRARKSQASSALITRRSMVSRCRPADRIGGGDQLGAQRQLGRVFASSR